MADYEMRRDENGVIEFLTERPDQSVTVENEDTGRVDERGQIEPGDTLTIHENVEGLANTDHIPINDSREAAMNILKQVSVPEDQETTAELVNYTIRIEREE